MTVEEGVNSFEISYEMKAGAPGYEPDELSSIMTKAQLLLIKELAPLIDYNEQFRKGVAPLIRYEELPPLNENYGLFPNGKLFETKAEVYRVLSESLKASGECVEEDKMKIIPMTFDRYKIMIDNPFWQPDFEHVWRIDMATNGGERRTQIVSSMGVTVEEYKIHYIKKPENIVYDEESNNNGPLSELDGSMHDMLIENAVRIATGNTYLDRYEIKSLEAQRNS